MTQNTIIRPGTEADQADAHRLYTLAKATMNAAGIDQWQGDYPSGDDFALDVNKDHAIVMEKDGIVIGIAAAYIGHEPTYDTIADGHWLTANHIYGIIHRIAVDPSARNSGAATAAFQWLEARCLENGIPSMRCDTHRDNQIMQRTLEKNGYQKCGIIYVEDGTQRLAYEKLL